jgi:hypothetical protein
MELAVLRARCRRFAAVMTALVAALLSREAPWRPSEAPCLMVVPDHLSVSSQCAYVRPDPPDTHQDSSDPDHPARAISAGVQGGTVVTRDFPAAMEIFTRQEQPLEVRQPVLVSSLPA